jgi:hypothetical protein
MPPEPERQIASIPPFLIGLLTQSVQYWTVIFNLPLH